jgi:tRNA-2-methylthio-N6-dimethylallyladenosine synthase
VNAYGKDLDKPASFHALLKAADQIPGMERIRFLTSHPRDFSPEMIEAIQETRHVCRHFHLPVQSGSDRILRTMNRGYTREAYIELTERIRAAFPEGTITTDIIVGFPGETDADFQDTLSLVERVGFDSAFTFMYSPRKGTPAASMKEQAPFALKKERLYALMQVQDAISLANHLKLKDRVVEVLAEDIKATEPCLLTGRTRGNHAVVFSGEPALLGTCVPVRVTDPQTWILKGEAQC